MEKLLLYFIVNFMNELNIMTPSDIESKELLVKSSDVSHNVLSVLIISK